MFQFPPIPQPSPNPSCTKGFLSFSFTYTGPGSISDKIVEEDIPVISVPGIFEITPNVIIVGNNVTVEIESCLYEGYETYPGNLGITFDKEPGIKTFNQYSDKFIPLPLIFFNLFTTNLTFISANNFPFSKEGSQFKGLDNINFLNTFIPYFLPGTSLASCFSDCTNFNSDISNWDTTNINNMASMFSGATQFNQPLNNWNTSNVTYMSNMFRQANSFNQNITRDVTNNYWITNKVTNINSIFAGFTPTGINLFNNGQIITGTTAPLNWVLAPSYTSSSYNLNCRLSNNNKSPLP